VLSWRDHVEDGPPIDEGRHRRDQAGVSQKVELAGRGRSAEAEPCGDRRGSPGAHRQEGDDPPPRRVGEEFDPWPASVWHDRPIMAANPSLPISRAGPIAVAWLAGSRGSFRMAETIGDRVWRRTSSSGGRIRTIGVGPGARGRSPMAVELDSVAIDGTTATDRGPDAVPRSVGLGGNVPRRFP
jgi:hypothetical protein